jgi:2',3'-cyclic-nucleotide 2'-phosphodiesterase (5'-nucleotidase family)
MIKRDFLAFLLLIFSLVACESSKELTTVKVEGEQLLVSDSISSNPVIDSIISPYKQQLDHQMNAVLSYSPYTLKVNDGEHNTAIGNMMADAVMELANPVYRSKTGKNIDLVLLNHGGIRSSIPNGNVTTLTAYQIMPFENEVVVAVLKAEQVQELINYLIDSGTAHPVAGLELEVNANNVVSKMLIQGKPLNREKKYHVATHDYLLQGGDNMFFFANATEVTFLDYKIRDLLIDFFKSRDTIAPVKDLRFIKLK